MLNLAVQALPCCGKPPPVIGLDALFIKYPGATTAAFGLEVSDRVLVCKCLWVTGGL